MENIAQGKQSNTKKQEGRNRDDEAPQGNKEAKTRLGRGGGARGGTV